MECQTNACGGYTEDLEQLSIMLLNVWRAFVCLPMKSQRYDLLFRQHRIEIIGKCLWLLLSVMRLYARTSQMVAGILVSLRGDVLLW